jgi:hypothetical protein
MDPAVAIHISLGSVLHAVLDGSELPCQVAHGGGAFDGRATRRTFDDFFTHILCDGDLVEIFLDDACGEEGVLKRLDGAYG